MSMTAWGGNGGAVGAWPTVSPAGSSSASARGRPDRALVDFEATVLAVLIEEALPRGSSVYASGTAGSYARGELARSLAQAVAAGGGIGIARLLAGRAGVG
jgi:hypothetical protein